jgi:hypothetical protein
MTGGLVAPNGVRATRAARQSKSMQLFLLGEVRRLAGRPTMDAWLEQVWKRKRLSKSRVTVEDILKTRDAGRDEMGG